MTVQPPTPRPTIARAAYRGRLIRTVNHTADTRSLFFQPEDARLDFVPGQFISVSVPTPSGTRLKPYTLASIPESGPPFEILFNLVPDGIASNYLFGLKAGDYIDFTGPYGTFTLQAAPDRESIFVAETTAIAPIRPMIHRVLQTPAHKPIRLIYAAPSIEQVIYHGEFERTAGADFSFSYETVIVPLDPARMRNPATICDLIKARYVSDRHRERRFFICGIGKAVLELRDLLRGAGYERRAVQYEQW
jgi:ferredoxin-NADP reductase